MPHPKLLEYLPRAIPFNLFLSFLTKRADLSLPPNHRSNDMFKATKGILTTLAITALLMMSAAATFGQTTGSVTMTATVSNFVELTSGGAVTLTRLTTTGNVAK